MTAGLMLKAVLVVAKFVLQLFWAAFFREQPISLQCFWGRVQCASDCPKRRRRVGTADDGYRYVHGADLKRAL